MATRLSQTSRGSAVSGATRGKRSSLTKGKRFLPAPSMDVATNNNNQGTKQEMEEMMESIFNQIVEDNLPALEAKRKAGQIPADETFILPDMLQHELQKYGHSFDDRLVHLLIDDIDENGDGMISCDEFKTIMIKCLYDANDEMLQAFAVVDSDGDGFISTVEFKRIMMTEGNYPLSDREADELMIFADSDGDGLVDYRKFLIWLNNPDKIQQT